MPGLPIPGDLPGSRSLGTGNAFGSLRTIPGLHVNLGPLAQDHAPGAGFQFNGDDAVVIGVGDEKGVLVDIQPARFPEFRAILAPLLLEQAGASSGFRVEELNLAVEGVGHQKTPPPGGESERVLQKSLHPCERPIYLPDSGHTCQDEI